MMKHVGFGTTALALCAMLSQAACSQQQFGLPSQSQQFGQQVTYNTEVDVLWVIDTSSSMDKHQNLLASQIGLFVEALNNTGLNYQIGVTTMDMGSGGAKGKLLAKAGTPAILQASTPNLIPVLADRIRIGADGSAIERGLESMKAALGSSSNATSPNYGFIRPNALLVTIFLTNEEDQSANEDYEAYLNSVRPPLPSGDRSWLVQYMGVMPNDPACQTSEWGYSSVGYRYMELATESGGLSESICDADLRRALTNVKARILEVMTEYKLDRVPNLATLKVWVEGIEIPNNPVNGYSYLAQSNSLRFHGTAVPRPGARIRIDYDPSGSKE